MPLIKSKSDKAFKSNLKAELAAGKPQKQALAIAYDVKRRSHKARGGEVKQMTNACPACESMAGLCEYHSNNGDSLIDKDVPSMPKHSQGMLSEESRGAQARYAEGGNVELEEADKLNPPTLSELAMRRRAHSKDIHDQKYAMGGKIQRNDIMDPEELHEDMQPQFVSSDANDFKNRDDVKDSEHDAGSVDEMEDESLSGMALKRRKR